MALPTYPQVRVAVTRPGAVRRRIEELNPDFIHIATGGAPWSMRMARLPQSRPSLYDLLPHALPRVPCCATSGAEQICLCPTSSVPDAGSGMMVPTETLGRELDRHGFVRLMRWSRGVDCNLFRPRAASIFEFPRPIFLTCARVAVEKNLDAFLSLDLPGSKVVFGDGPARKKLQKRFPRAHFVGEMRDERLAAAYASADVFVFPSLTDTFGLMLLEALASGLPVAANPVVGPLDVIGDSGAGVLDANLGRAALAALSIPRELARALALTFSLGESAVPGRSSTSNVPFRSTTNSSASATRSAFHTGKASRSCLTWPEFLKQASANANYLARYVGLRGFVPPGGGTAGGNAEKACVKMGSASYAAQE